MRTIKTLITGALATVGLYAYIKYREEQAYDNGYADGYFERVDDEQRQRAQIEQVNSEAYDRGFADGYFEHVRVDQNRDPVKSVDPVLEKLLQHFKVIARTQNDGEA